jgi:hypothetical protein
MELVINLFGKYYSIWVCGVTFLIIISHSTLVAQLVKKFPVCAAETASLNTVTSE